MSRELQTAGKCAAVTASDTVAIAGGPARALYVGVAGTVVVVDPEDTATSFVGVAAGTVLPVRCKRVNSTSTTASSIVALF